MSPHASICATRHCGMLIASGKRHCRHHEKAANARHNEASRDLRSPQGRRLRAQVLREETSCAICGATGKLTLGHIVARSLGGDPYARENAQAECESCNYSRGGALAHG